VPFSGVLAGDQALFSSVTWTSAWLLAPLIEPKWQGSAKPIRPRPKDRLEGMASSLYESRFQT
jgi:hypothetical protein